jgi:hypothetical protein
LQNNGLTLKPLFKKEDGKTIGIIDSLYMSLSLYIKKDGRNHTRVILQWLLREVKTRKALKNNYEKNHENIQIMKEHLRRKQKRGRKKHDKKSKMKQVYFYTF